MNGKKKQIRLCIIAPSGSGKSTVARMMKEAFESAGMTVGIAKLAAPLYALQAEFYRECGLRLEPGRQDQRLLEIIATEMRRIKPDSLVRSFEHRLESSESDVVINDDLRDDLIDGPRLREHGFLIIRVVCDSILREQRLLSRGDISVVSRSNLDGQIERIREDFVLTNDESLERLRTQVDKFAAVLAEYNR